MSIGGKLIILGDDSDRLTVVGKTNGISAASITYSGGLLVAKGNTQATSVEVNDGAVTPAVVSPLAGAYNSNFAVWGPTNTYTVLNTTLDLTGTWSSSDWSDSTNSRGWKWDYNSGGSTLTLKNIIINGHDKSGGAYGVYLPNNANVVLEGVNVASAGNESISYGRTSGVAGLKNLTITGNGTLISLAGKIDGQGSYGIHSTGGVSIGMGSDAPNVTAISTNQTGGEGFGMGNTPGFVVNSGTVTAIGTSYGIRSSAKSIINGGTITASGGQKAMDYTPSFGDNFGVTAGTWDGKFVRTGEGGEVPYLIWVGNTQVTSANKNDVLGDGKVAYTLAGSETPQKLTLSGVNITETYEDDFQRQAGIYSLGELEIALSPGTINTVDCSASNSFDGTSYGIYAWDGGLTISGAGTLKLTAGMTTGFSTGILSRSVAITEANVEATGKTGVYATLTVGLL